MGDLPIAQIEHIYKEANHCFYAVAKLGLRLYVL